MPLNLKSKQTRGSKGADIRYTSIELNPCVNITLEDQTDLFSLRSKISEN